MHAPPWDSNDKGHGSYADVSKRKSIRTQSPRAFLSAVDRLETLWDNGISLNIITFLFGCCSANNQSKNSKNNSTIPESLQMTNR